MAVHACTSFTGLNTINVLHGALTVTASHREKNKTPSIKTESPATGPLHARTSRGSSGGRSVEELGVEIPRN